MNGSNMHIYSKKGKFVRLSWFDPLDYSLKRRSLSSEKAGINRAFLSGYRPGATKARILNLLY